MDDFRIGEVNLASDEDPSEPRRDGVDDESICGGGDGGGEETGNYESSGATATDDVEIVIDDDGDRTNQAVTFSGDPTRKVDFVLHYDATKDSESRANMRREFEDNLQDFGIQLERELSAKDCFVKLNCPFDALCRGAELVRLKKPIKKKQITTMDKKRGCLCCREKDLTKLQIYQSFNMKNKKDFLNVEDENAFFTSGERNYIVYSLLEKTTFRSSDVTHTGLGMLLDKEVYGAAYPLHDPLPARDTASYDSMNEREILIRKWTKFKNLLSLQPLEQIKNYFGEQFTFYFAWMGLYTIFLSFASLAGLACFIYGLVTFLGSDIVRDVCDSSKEPGNYTICPKCDGRCNYTILSDGCNYARFTGIFDNEATVFAAAFICVWSICFLEFWKRKQLFLQYEWSVHDFETDENIRPQYYSQTDDRIKNPFSGEEESTVSCLCKGARLLTSLSLILFLLTIVIAATFSVLIYRLAVVYALYQTSDAFMVKNAKLITTFTAAILNVFCITILSFVYQLIAKLLTNLEAHKTRTSYEDSFIFKMMIFQFINNYGSIIYIAFLKGSFVDSPGHESLYVFGKYRQDECDESGCFSELTVQLIIIMIGKQLLNATLEMAFPVIMRCIRSIGKRSNGHSKQWEKDLVLQDHPPISMFSEYMEMVIQFGFVVLFVAAFPLAPLFAFVNDVLEIRLDAHKMVKMFRRPPALKAQDVGAWQGCLTALSYTAVITNAFIIAWTSDFIPRLVYKLNLGPSLRGYVAWSLVPFNVSLYEAHQRPDEGLFPAASSVGQCRYRSFSAPSGQVDELFLPFYWQILCARWAFVIVFEHVCFLLMSLARLIPDMSREVKLRHRYARAVTDDISLFGLFELVKEKRKSNGLAASVLMGFDDFDE